jgi:hypothetical protein
VSVVSFVVFEQVLDTHCTDGKPMERIVPGAIVFQGQSYLSVDEMPAGARKAYEHALQMLGDAVPSGAADAWEEEGPGPRAAPGPADVTASA